MNIASVTVHISADLVAVFLIQFKIPANRCIIVMGTCVADTVFGVEIRQKIAFCGVIEGKLKYLHTREMEGITELFNLRGDHTEIFCKNRKVFAKFLLDCTEKGSPRAFDPFAIDSCFIAIRDRPVSFKTAEMINTQIIYKLELLTDTGDPPCITGFFVFCPIVERIAPELTGF